jgi:hypothetical protein
MPFPHIEAGGPLLHAIPQSAVDHPRYLPGDSRRAVYAAGIQGGLYASAGTRENPVDHTGRHVSDPDCGNRSTVTDLVKP